MGVSPPPSGTFLPEPPKVRWDPHPKPGGARLHLPKIRDRGKAGGGLGDSRGCGALTVRGDRGAAGSGGPGDPDFGGARRSRRRPPASRDPRGDRDRDRDTGSGSGFGIVTAGRRRWSGRGGSRAPPSSPRSLTFIGVRAWEKSPGDPKTAAAQPRPPRGSQHGDTNTGLSPLSPPRGGNKIWGAELGGPSMGVRGWANLLPPAVSLKFGVQSRVPPVLLSPVLECGLGNGTPKFRGAGLDSPRSWPHYGDAGLGKTAQRCPQNLGFRAAPPQPLLRSVGTQKRDPAPPMRSPGLGPILGAQNPAPPPHGDPNTEGGHSSVPPKIQVGAPPTPATRRPRDRPRPLAVFT